MYFAAVSAYYYYCSLADTRFSVCAVFKYPAPTAKIFPHNVYLLKDKFHYKTCTIVGGELLSNVTQGAGKGFYYMLRKPKYYYFACGIGNGTHCESGLMKFTVKVVKH